MVGIWLIVSTGIGFLVGMMLGMLFIMFGWEEKPTITHKPLFWKIVRYKKDGTFDCIWSSGFDDIRVANQRCEWLNNPNEGHNYWRYGTYVVEEY